MPLLSLLLLVIQYLIHQPFFSDRVLETAIVRAFWFVEVEVGADAAAAAVTVTVTVMIGNFESQYQCPCWQVGADEAKTAQMHDHLHLFLLLGIGMRARIESWKKLVIKMWTGGG